MNSSIPPFDLSDFDPSLMDSNMIELNDLLKDENFDQLFDNISLSDGQFNQNTMIDAMDQTLSSTSPFQSFTATPNFEYGLDASPNYTTQTNINNNYSPKQLTRPLEHGQPEFSFGSNVPLTKFDFSLNAPEQIAEIGMIEKSEPKIQIVKPTIQQNDLVKDKCSSTIPSMQIGVTENGQTLLYQLPSTTQVPVG